MKLVRYLVKSEEGLHARPASLLTGVASKYPDRVDIIYQGKKLTLKSIMIVMGLGIPHNAEFEIEVEGAHEDEIVTLLTKVLTDNSII